MTDPMMDLKAMMEEPLCEALKEHLTESAMGPFVKHPLVFGSATLPGQLNRQLEFKLKATAEAYGNADWSRYLWLHERPYRMPTLHTLWTKRQIGRGQLKALLAQVWQDTEMPHQFGDICVELFKASGFITDDAEGWSTLQDPLEIYRGGFAHGISWTTDREKAAWFGRRFYRADHYLWTGRVLKHKCFAYITDRAEHEVVVEWKRINILSKERIK